MKFSVVRLSTLLVFASGASAVDEPADTHQDALTLNQKADGYRGIWYMNQPSGDEYVYKYSGGLATYCAKHQPFAVYSEAAAKTFFCYGAHPDFYALWADGHGREPSVSSLYFSDREGNVWRLPEHMDGDTAAPENVTSGG